MTTHKTNQLLHTTLLVHTTTITTRGVQIKPDETHKYVLKWSITPLPTFSPSANIISFITWLYSTQCTRSPTQVHTIPVCTNLQSNADIWQCINVGGLCAHCTPSHNSWQMNSTASQCTTGCYTQCQSTLKNSHDETPHKNTVMNQFLTHVPPHHIPL